MTFTEQESSGGNTGLPEATFTKRLISILTMMDNASTEYVDKLLKLMAKVNPFKSLNEEDGDDTDDERPKIVQII